MRLIRRSRTSSLLLWSVPAVISAVHAYQWAQFLGRPISILRALASESPPWVVMAFLAEPIVRFAIRWPLRPPRIVRILTFHAALFSGVSLAVAATYTLSFMLLRKDWTIIAYLRLFPHILTDTLPKLALCFIALYREAQATMAERQRAALAVRLAQAQLRALESQLHPHFLFNTLDSAVALVREGDPQRASRALVLLSEMLRSILSWRDEDSVELEEELDFVRRYVELARVRFEDRLAVTWSIDPDARDALVPPLSLQPLVENAFRHGLEKRRHAGQLIIAARVLEGALELSVEDDGPGPAADLDLARSKGIGLSGTRARLLEAYGDGAALMLTARDGGGTRAVVRIPLRYG